MRLMRVGIGSVVLLTALGPCLARATEPPDQAPDAAQDREDAQAEREKQRAEREQQRAERQQEVRQRQAEREHEARERQAEREEDAYERGTDALDDCEWDDAVKAFSEVISLSGKRIDAALYWKAYAQSRSGRRADALAGLGELRRLYPKSRWLAEARALEAEIRRASGEKPAPDALGDDDDLKLMALGGLLESDAERALPMIEKLLAGTASLKVKDRALFVLSQSDSPRARALVGQIARNGANPHLQGKALKYLGISGDAASRQILAEVYAGSAEVDVKRTILQAFMVAGDKARVLAAAKGETAPELRRDAIRQLGAMAAHAELWDLYRSESVVELKREIIQALFVGDAADKLLELARTEPVPELRRTAIRNLGLLSSGQTGAALVTLYGRESVPELKSDIVQALFVQGNARALVELARAEKDPQQRKLIVRQLSHMDQKAATDFMLEILEK